MNSDSLSDWLGYINSKRPNEKEFGLERLKGVYSELIKKPIAAKTILIAGTNGKGSTAEFLKNFLFSAGFTVGVYTSPHLIHFNERIRINENQICDEKIVSSFKKIEDCKGKTKLTYFDYATLAAFDIFSEAQLDFAILEIGIGGKYDPVNLLDSDISIITNIDLDHEKWLGRTLNDIGFQKAAILKEGKVGILGNANMPDSVNIRASEVCSKKFQLGEDYIIQKNMKDWEYKLLDYDFQLENIPFSNLNNESIASAVTAFKILTDRDVNFHQIIEKTFLKGRCDSIENFILDASHNPASVRNLITFLSENHKSKKFKAIFSCISEKDFSSMIRDISPLISEWIVCEMHDIRFNTDDLVNAISESINGKVTIADSVYSAVEREYHEGNDCLVFGSFITVSQAYKALNQLKNKPEDENY